jgi:hypothetical protein
MSLPTHPLFRAHKEVLYFASPFFEAALSGNWSETGRPPSMSSVITISQLPVVPGDKTELEAAMTFAPVDPDGDSTDFDSLFENARLSENETSDAEIGIILKSQARGDSLAKLQGSSSSHHTRPSEDSASSSRKFSAAHAKVKRKPKDGPDAVIVLKEERVCAPFASLVPLLTLSPLGEHLS